MEPVAISKNHRRSDSPFVVGCGRDCAFHGMHAHRHVDRSIHTRAGSWRHRC